MANLSRPSTCSKSFIAVPMAKPFFNHTATAALALLIILNPIGLAVTSKLTRHCSQADFLKGQTEKVIIDSRGTLQLARACRRLATDFQDVWAVNTIVADGDALFLGTSPNGHIYKYFEATLTKIYSPKTGAVTETEPNDPNTTAPQPYLTNQHVFAMAIDKSGRLLAGISGEECRLIRFDNQDPQTIFEPADARYIFAIVLDEKANIYLGTGPEGKLYRLDADGTNQQLIYDVEDKNILSLAVGQDGFIYAGTDQRAVVYKINPETSTAGVLYDTEQAEIAALLFDEYGNLYAAATSAQAVKTKAKAPAPAAPAGRPEIKPEKKSSALKKNALELKIPNIAEKTSAGKKAKSPAHPARGTSAPKASHIYKINKSGFVTDLFAQSVVFYALSSEDGQLLIPTGNNAQLFTLNPETEQQAVTYEDKQASQITALAVVGDDVYLGTANPPKLIRLEKSFAAEGTYTSNLIDAAQPAQWGKLQLEADIPAGSKVLLATRSGNVKDVNDPTFSPWTEPVEVAEPTQLFCPVGRFCQYKLTLKTDSPDDTPVIREVAVAHSVPNLEPKVESVTISRIKADKKKGRFKISFKAKDDNKDKLIYKIQFRKIGRTNWIELKDKLESDSFEWDGRTVEDARYEVKVTASDERDNTALSKLTGVRISDPVIIDNTAPAIEQLAVTLDAKNAILTLRLKDQLSAIGKVSYTVDSNAEWKGTLPEDAIYDTTSEDFTILVRDLDPGEHVIALKIADAAENTFYKTFEIMIEQD